VLENGKIRPLEMQREHRISCNKYAGTEIKIGEEEYLIMREYDVLGVIRDQKRREEKA
jgi:chaperonin GroES